MCEIRIKSFGPIKEGYQENGGWMNIKKVTVFIGSQGSGKSTVAKLISTLTWIEKALVRGDFAEKDLIASNNHNTNNLFKKHCSYQNIGNYFKKDTEIEYKGKAFYIAYKNGKVLLEKSAQNRYSFPKIMYVPSERNFVSSVRNVRTLRGLPSTLYTFSDEFINAVEELKGQVDLPINNAKFEYQKLNKLSWIVGEDYKIKLAEASSGFQSFVPLFLVTSFLANSLNRKEDNAVKEISIEQEKRIRKEIEIILSNSNISADVKRASLEFLSSRLSYSAFINIVEEPEQNLFPTSQRKILNSLLQFNNMSSKNSLIITTHSPYVINYITLAVKAFTVSLKISECDKKIELYAKLKEIVPVLSTINPANLTIYELDENGNIVTLADYKGLPSDKNYLNQQLAETNFLFDDLSEIERQCK